MKTLLLTALLVIPFAACGELPNPNVARNAITTEVAPTETPPPAEVDPTLDPTLADGTAELDSGYRQPGAAPMPDFCSCRAQKDKCNEACQRFDYGQDCPRWCFGQFEFCTAKCDRLMEPSL